MLKVCSGVNDFLFIFTFVEKTNLVMKIRVLKEIDGSRTIEIDEIIIDSRILWSVGAAFLSLLYNWALDYVQFPWDLNEFSYFFVIKALLGIALVLTTLLTIKQLISWWLNYLTER